MTTSDDKSLELVQEADDDPPLHSALASGNKEEVESLLRNGVDPNITNEKRLTPLHVICENLGKDDVDLMDLFFRINDELNQPVQLDVQNKEGSSALHLAVYYGYKKATELLLRRGARSNLANAEGLTPLHIICKKYDDDDDDDDDDNDGLAELFFKINDEKHQLVQINAQDNEGNTPLHLAMEKDDRNLIELLLRRGADPNTTNKAGLTPLHIHFSQRDFRDFDAFYDFNDGDDLIESLFKICDEKNHPVRIDIRDESGNTLLHWAMRHAYKKTSELLLRRGADPNSTNADGCTALHVVCRFFYEYDLTKMLFELSNDDYQPVRLDVRDKSGNTPLHVALEWGGKEVPLMLLERGADINLANEDGATPLHVLCEREIFDDDSDFVRAFFKIIEDERRTVRVNAQNKFGDTPLHLALVGKHKRLVKLLLENDADPNLANAEGSTALHVACRGREQDDLAEILFEFSDDEYRPLRVDAVDETDRTPLQWAVLNLSLNIIDVLLDNGADLAKFVFPTANQFSEAFEARQHKHWLIFDLELLSGTLDVVGLLRKRGYELERGDALTIMDVFAGHGLLKNSADLEERWYKNEEFAREADKIMMSMGLSFYELTQLVYERLARTFCQPWALDSLLTLTGYRLPILCCEMIIDYVDNKDLRNICLADTDQSS